MSERRWTLDEIKKARQLADDFSWTELQACLLSLPEPPAEEFDWDNAFEYAECLGLSESFSGTFADGAQWQWERMKK